MCRMRTPTQQGSEGLARAGAEGVTGTGTISAAEGAAGVSHQVSLSQSLSLICVAACMILPTVSSTTLSLLAACNS